MRTAGEKVSSPPTTWPGRGWWWMVHKLVHAVVTGAVDDALVARHEPARQAGVRPLPRAMASPPTPTGKGEQQVTGWLRDLD
ncbi:hypothetical protein [Actinophytocola sp. NPDC049390]|uniref:hypothetical protein n=1 Tax=Actinophytocola sp. NPDC049390 TaxID=3363894 RepID=UPI0037900F10